MFWFVFFHAPWKHIYWTETWFGVIHTSQWKKTQFTSHCHTKVIYEFKRPPTWNSYHANGGFRGSWNRLQPKNNSILSPVCLSVHPDGWPAGGQEDLHHQRGPAVPQALLRGGNHDQPGLLHTTLPAAAGRHQGQGVREHTQTLKHTHVYTHIGHTGLTGLFSSRIVKIPDNPDSLSFRLCGSAPPHVHAVRKGEWLIWVTPGATLIITLFYFFSGVVNKFQYYYFCEDMENTKQDKDLLLKF